MGMFQTRGSNERYGIIEGAAQRTVASAGSNQATAALIGANVTLVTGATGATGVVLRRAKGTSYGGMIYSSAATNALLVYPPVGGTINNGTIDAAFSLPARKPVQFYSIDNINFIFNLSA